MPAPIFPFPPGKWVPKGSHFVVRYWASTGPTSLFAHAEVVYDSGKRAPFDVTIESFTADRTPILVEDTQLTEEDGVVVVGFLTGSTLLQRGEFFTRFEFIRKGDRESVILGQDYFYENHPIPMGVQVDSGPSGGRGFTRSIALGDPAANTQLTAQTVPTDAIWEVKSADIAESAAGAATRAWEFRYTDGTTIVARVHAAQRATGVTSNVGASIGASVGDDTALNQQTIALPGPNFYLLEGWTFQPFLVGIAAADNIAASQMSVEEWIRQ